MADFLKILEQKIDFSPSEQGVAERWFRQVERDNLFANAISSSGGGGGVTSLQAGNVTIDWSEGITLRNPANSKRSIYLDPDGDAWFGSDIDEPSETTMFIISNDNVYNGESFGAGDLLIGDNSSGKANMHWDQSTGTLSFRSGTTDSVVIGDGGIVATWGEIGGWVINETTIVSPDDAITLDSANEKITVGTGTSIIIDGANELIKSSNYQEDSAGWQIDSAGRAEFGAIRARGSIQAAVFEYESISATGGGTLVVPKDASEVWVLFTISNSVGGGGSFYAWNRNRGSVAFAAVGDIVAAKVWDGSSYITFEGSISSVGSDLGGYRLYAYTYVSGDLGENIYAGAPIVNYGPSGFGQVSIEGGATPRVVISTHAGSPLVTVTDMAVFGNMKNKFGTGANDRYGIGMGDYSGGNYLSYNAETADAFVLKAGDGQISITEDGMRITEDDTEGTARIRWVYDDSGTERILGGVYGEYDSSGSGHVTLNVYAGKWASYPWAYGQVTIWSYDNDTGDKAWISVGAIDGQDIYGTTDDGAIVFDAHGDEAVLRSWDGANYSAVFVAPAGTVTLKSDNVVHLSNKGMYIGSTGAGAVGDGQLEMTGGLLALDGVIRSEGTSDPTNQGDGGIEISWESTYGRLLSYGRGPTTSGDQPLQLRASKIEFYEGGSVCLTIDNQDLYSQGFADYSASSTVVGWSSFTVKEIYYKTIGDMVFVWVYLNGTSNSTSATFTLPYKTKNSNQNVAQTVVRVGNSGTPAFGFINVPQNSQTCTCYRTAAASTGWTASGTKYVIGQFCYQRA